MKKFILILIIALAFTTCDDKPDTHTHTWSDWQSNAEQHWKECSCGEKTDIGNHTGNPCTICGYETETPAVPQPKIIDNTNGLAFDGKVTISTSDLYTVADWDAVVQKVIAALNRGYGKNMSGLEVINESAFISLFEASRNMEVIVSKSASHNIEVKSGEYTILYLKESSLDTVDVQPAVWVMTDGDGSNYQA